MRKHMNFLRQIRKQNGFRSQWKLSLISSVAQSRISLMENGLVIPSKREKSSLSKALNINIEDIFPKKKEGDEVATTEKIE